MRISVVVCGYTEERWNDLLAAITSARQQTLPPDEIILVIDHNTAMYEHATRDIPGVVVVENADIRGVSGARNTGISFAQGDLIAFLDDDAVAAPTWLERLCGPFSDPDVLGTGGALEPAWDAPRPAWFPDEFKWVVGCTYRGLPETTAPVRNPIGANFCMRRIVFETVGGFRTQLGRQGRVAAGCEETELSIRAHKHWPDGKFVFEPAAKATHRVPVWRTHWAYFRGRCYAEGLSKARISRLIGTSAGLAAERSYVRRTLPSGIARALATSVVDRDFAAFTRAGAIVAGLAFTTCGYLVGSLRERVIARGRPDEAPTISQRAAAT